jgi:hypothetical protein
MTEQLVVGIFIIFFTAFNQASSSSVNQLVRPQKA